jgi:hypothetical protein
MRMSEQLYARYTDDELALLLRFLEDAAELHEGVFAELRARLQAAASSTV